jgi:hypothetical protein
MVHFLINHGPEKFAEIFLGEFDTPEAIWSSEMRYKSEIHILTFQNIVLPQTAFV